MHELIIKSSAEKAMERIPHNVYLAVKKRIQDLREEPRPRGTKKLSDGITWRIRVGDYRVIYTIDDHEKSIRIVAVKHRQSAYDRKS